MRVNFNFVQSLFQFLFFLYVEAIKAHFGGKDKSSYSYWWHSLIAPADKKWKNPRLEFSRLVLKGLCSFAASSVFCCWCFSSCFCFHFCLISIYDRCYLVFSLFYSDLCHLIWMILRKIGTLFLVVFFRGDCPKWFFTAPSLALFRFTIFKQIMSLNYVANEIECNSFRGFLLDKMVLGFFFEKYYTLFCDVVQIYKSLYKSKCLFISIQ